ncbi:MAG: acyl-CoA dehydratase activase [Pseudomonadota bacterium]
MTGPVLLGLDLGTVNIKLIVLEPGGTAAAPRVALVRPGRGNSLRAARELLGEAGELLGAGARVRIGLTGAAARSAAAALHPAVRLNEIVAAAAGVGVVHPEIRTVLDLGGQFSKWILVDRGVQDPLGRVEDFALNGLCAAGSGAFLEQQATRLEMSLPELASLAEGAARGATIAGRCSVFAKSDMIHLQQKGTPADEIAYGLCQALARTFVATVLEGRQVEPPVALVGGGASNPGLVRALLEVFAFEEGDRVVPDQHLFACARGAALAAASAPARALAGVLVDMDAAGLTLPETGGGTAGHPRLPDDGAAGPPPPASTPPAQRRGPVTGHLGIDVGSVSTNVVLLSEDLELLEETYVATRGRPVEALDEALAAISGRFVGGEADLGILSVGATGSGRHLADRLVGADLVKNEITAQLVSAAHYVPEVDTVFEIGGQDSKFIDARGGQLREFEMNKICAAGTGSFLEEQAERLGVRIVGEFAARALQGASPVDLGSRCTVFMDTELCHAMARDATVEDLCAGLAYSVARNYLEKVVDGREIGERVVFQGGTSANGAVVAAFHQLLGRPVKVHPHGRVSGAIGAALLSARGWEAGTSPRFRGFQACSEHEITSFECARCENRCQVNRVRVGERSAHFGDVCERYTSLDRTAAAGEVAPRPFPELFAAREALLEAHLPGPGTGGRPRVGLVRASLSLESLPFWAALVDDLGFEPVVAAGADGAKDPGVRGLPAEVCLPLKIANAQVHHLLQVDGVERVLLPAVFELDRRHGRDRPCTCLYAQHLADMTRLVHGERVLVPQLGLSADRGIRREGVRALADALGASARAVRRAWDHGAARQAAFVLARQRLGAEVLASLSGDAVVVLGKPYNLHDPRANLGLARQLERVGLPAIPMDLLPLGDEVLEEAWYMLAWQLNRDQVRALQFAARRPGLAPIHVSSYGCGPDAFAVKHLERAWGRRPLLLLEFDEHKGEAGLVTRLEAFADEIASHRRRRSTASPWLRRPEARDNLDLPPGTRCVVPYTSAHVHVYAGALRSVGLEARILPPPDAEVLRLGEEVASGRECHPYAILAGDLARLVKAGDVKAGDRYFLPSTRLPCLLGQYGDGLRRVLEALGEDRIRVFDQHPGEANALFGARGMVALYEGLSLVDYLIVAGCLLRPREITPGAVEEALRECYAGVERRGAERSSARRCLVRCMDRLRRVPLEPEQPRPIVGVTGDLYTRINEAGNASLFERLEAMGCAVWPSPFVGASSDFELPQNARRWLARGEPKRALKDQATATVLRTCSARLAAVLERDLRERCVEPPQPVLQGYAVRYVGANANHLVRSLVAKMVDFATRGADGVISAVGLGCMVGVTVTAAIPAIRRDHGGLPIVSIAYGGSEGPAQQIQLETFVHQVKQRFERRRA